MAQSKDLENGYYTVENPEEWLCCPHCGEENIDLKNFGKYNDQRTIVDCPKCEADGFFD